MILINVEQRVLVFLETPVTAGLPMELLEGYSRIEPENLTVQGDELLAIVISLFLTAIIYAGSYLNCSELGL